MEGEVSRGGGEGRGGMRLVQLVCNECGETDEWDWDETVTNAQLESISGDQGWEHFDNNRDLCPACAEKEGQHD